MSARVLLTGLLLALLLCGSAEARPKLVARYGEFTLRAQGSGERFCITLRRNRHYQGQACGRMPRSPLRALQIYPDVGWNNYASAVPASVRVAESEAPDGTRKRHPTFASPAYPALRFVIVPAPPGVKFVRFYGADGALLGMDAGQAGYIGADGDVTYLLGDRENGVEAHTERRIWPSPGQADRVRTLACLSLDNSTGGEGLCADESEGVLGVLDACGEPNTLGALVPAGVAGVRLTLGSGASADFPVRELPPAFGGARAFAAEVPAGQAIRAATALDAGGAPVAQVMVGTAPSGQPCPSTDQGDDRFTGRFVPLAPPSGAATVAPGLVAADQGTEALCVGVGALAAENCPAPPADSDEPRLLRSGTTVGGVLSGDAATITLRLDQGAAVTARVTDGPAYTGRWAGGVRFFSASVPAERKVVGATVRNTAGFIIGTSPKGVPDARVNRRALLDSVQLVRAAGEQPCVTAVDAEQTPSRFFCSDPTPGHQIDGPYLPYDGAVTVSCSTHTAVAYGRFPDDEAVPSVLLAGRSIRARRIKLPFLDAWIAPLPDATVLGFRAGKHRAALHLPPASQQCGYSVSRAF